MDHFALVKFRQCLISILLISHKTKCTALWWNIRQLSHDTLPSYQISLAQIYTHHEDTCTFMCRYLRNHLQQVHWILNKLILELVKVQNDMFILRVIKVRSSCFFDHFYMMFEHSFSAREGTGELSLSIKM